MAIYTFIMEYRGGTYVSQVKATSVANSIRKWARDLPVAEITHFGPKLKRRLLDGLDQDEYGIYGATALTGVTNVWYIHVPLPISVGTTITAVRTDTQ